MAVPAMAAPAAAGAPAPSVLMDERTQDSCGPPLQQSLQMAQYLAKDRLGLYPKNGTPAACDLWFKDAAILIATAKRLGASEAMMTEFAQGLSR